MSRAMKDACARLVRGEIDFAAFARATHDDWHKLAKLKFRAAALPAGVELEDVVQEALLGAWFGARNYDPRIKANPTEHIITRALNRAGKFCASQRGRKGHKKGDWALPGQFPCSESFLRARSAREEEDEQLLDRASAPGSLDWDAHAHDASERPARDLLAAERVRALAGAMGERHRAALECIADAGGSLQLAAELFARHPEAEALGVIYESEAAACVRAAADGVFKILG